MLTDLTLRNLKPRVTLYKVTDRDGMYVAITPTGSISFRFDYRINGRRETLTIGRYGYGGISLAAARGKLLQAKQLLRDGISPALQKRREKARGPETKTFGDHATQWLYGATMAESTRAMRKSVLNRDILPNFSKRLLSEVRAEDLRALCMRVKDRGAPATAIHVREIVKQIYGYAFMERKWPILQTRSVQRRSPPSCQRIGRCLPLKSNGCAGNLIWWRRMLRYGSPCV